MGSLGANSKEKKLVDLQRQYDEAKGIIAKAKIYTEMEMLKADWKGTVEEWRAYQEELRKQKEAQYEAQKRAEAEEKRAREEAIKANLENELRTQPKDKVEQFNIIQATNPMNDEYHTGIRKPSDIKTWSEVLKDSDNSQFLWGDFSRKDAEKAMQSGKITIYSSYPIKDGVFVSTSKAQSQEYAGGAGNKVYSKTVSLSDVAWINGDEGQFARIRGRK